MKILAFGDAQLGAHGRLDDQREVMERIARLAVDRHVDLVLDGGDTLEGGEVKPEHLRVFADFVATLRDAGIPVVAVQGNGRHDRHRGSEGLDIFREIPGVTVASTPDVYRFDGCTVAAMPWVSPARLQATYGSAANRDEVNAHVAELLVGVAQDLNEDCRRVGPDLPAVLLTHFAISGASLPTGLPVDMLREPVLPLAELEALGFGAIVASHIHRPQLLTGELGGGPVFFTGSPMAHDFGEAGFEHGVWILDDMRPEFVAMESRALVTLDIDPDEFRDPDAAWCPENVDGALVRVRYTATTEQVRHLDLAAIRAQLHATGAHAVQVDAHIVRADRARVEGLDDSMSELDAVDEWVRVNEIDELVAGLMVEKTREYLAAVA